MTREEAIEVLKKKVEYLESDKRFKAAVETLIPELRESEDERIRKELVEAFEALDIDSSWNGIPVKSILAWFEKQKEQKSIIQDVELNDAVYDYVRDHFIAGADFTPEYIKKLMENAFFAGVDYYLLKQESESCEPDTNVEKVIEDVIRVYRKTQGEWIGGYDVDSLIVNLRRAFNKKEQKQEWSEEDEKMLKWIEDILLIADDDLSDKLNGRVSPITNSAYSSMKLCIAKCRSWLKSLPLNLKKKNEDVAKLCSKEWSQEDEDRIRQIERIAQQAGCTQKLQEEIHDWLKSLRPQPKPEWSEEDEENLEKVIWYIEKGCKLIFQKPDKLISWLKSLRPSQKLNEEEIKKIRSEEYTKGFNDAAFGGKLKEWSEEDESELTAVIYCVSRAIKASKDENERNSLLSAKKWLQDKLSFRVKSLRPQKLDASKLENFDPVEALHRIKKEWPMAWEKVVPTQEWSEEDEKLFWGFTAYIPNEELERLGVTKNDILKKLKSIRLQPIQLKEAYKDGFQTARQATASTFMTYLDENRPEGKMGLSNSECEDIDKAFKENDWAKIMRYVEKYRPHWKPSEEQMEAMSYFVRKHQATANRATTKWPEFEAFKSLYNDLKKQM